MMMKKLLLTLLCSSAFALTALAQDPSAPASPAAPTPPALEAAPSPPAAPTGPTASPRSPRRDDGSLESRIERRVRDRVHSRLGINDNGADRDHDGDFDELGPIMAIPIIGIIFTTLFGAPVLIVGLIMFFSYWKARSLHRTVRMMVEKGQPVPPELFVEHRTPARARNDMRKGVVLLMIGLGLIIFFGVVADWDDGVWAIGMIPFLMGAGYLTVWKLEGNKPALSHTSSDNNPPVS